MASNVRNTWYCFRDQWRYSLVNKNRYDVIFANSTPIHQGFGSACTQMLSLCQSTCVIAYREGWKLPEPSRQNIKTLRNDYFLMIRKEWPVRCVFVDWMHYQKVQVSVGGCMLGLHVLPAYGWRKLGPVRRPKHRQTRSWGQASARYGWGSGQAANVNGTRCWGGPGGSVVNGQRIPYSRHARCVNRQFFGVSST